MTAECDPNRFSQIPAWALDDDRLSMSGLRMLCLLGTYSNRKGWSWASQEDLAGRLGNISQQAISKAITELKKLGYIEVRYTGGGQGFAKRANYRILFDADCLPQEHDRYYRHMQEKRKRAVEREQEFAEPHTTEELSAEADTIEGLSRVQPSGSMRHNPPVVENTPIEHTQKNTPSILTSSPPAAASEGATVISGKALKPSKDGQPPKEWERAFVAHCYDGETPATWREQVRPLHDMRKIYPLAVVLRYVDYRKAGGRQGPMMPREIANTIVGWSDLKDEMRKWEEARDGGTAVDGGRVGEDQAADRGDGGKARSKHGLVSSVDGKWYDDPWDAPENADLLRSAD